MDTLRKGIVILFIKLGTLKMYNDTDENKDTKLSTPLKSG